MNQSLQRALNQVSMLKKVLNSQKTSHQNTLQQLQQTYQIIQEMKQLLKNEQQRTKSMNLQIRQKTQKIQQLSYQYQSQIMNIKQLIERKDIEIKKYSQIKVTDYDMIRLRVINQIEGKHTEQIEQYKNQIKRQEFINNENLYQLKIMKQKNQQLVKQIQEIKQNIKSNHEETIYNHAQQLNRLYKILDQQKSAKKLLQKKINDQKNNHTQIVKKYHIQLQAAQMQLFHLGSGKQNNRKYSNINNGNILQLKQNQFALQNEKLKKNMKEKQTQFSELKSKYKNEIKDLRRQMNELQNQLLAKTQEVNKLRIQLSQCQQTKLKEMTRLRKQLQKKEETQKDKFQQSIDTKTKEIKTLKKQIEQMKEHKPYESGPKFIHLQNKNDFQRQDKITQNLKQENQQLRQKNKKLNDEINKLKTTFKQKQKTFGEIENRQTRSISVQDVKNKLKEANNQIVSLLKEKIALNEKISRMAEKR